MNETQGLKDVIIIQVDSNSLSDYLNMITNVDDRGTLVQSYKYSYATNMFFCVGVQLSFYSGVNVS